MANKSLVKIVNNWPVIDIGAMRHHVTIQQWSVGSPVSYDESGPVLSWNDFLYAEAAIDIMRGSDVIRGGQTTTQLYLSVVMYYQDGILPQMRVVNDNGSIYVIQSIENVREMNQVIVLNCIGLNENV